MNCGLVCYSISIVFGVSFTFLTCFCKTSTLLCISDFVEMNHKHGFVAVVQMICIYTYSPTSYTENCSPHILALGTAALTVYCDCFWSVLRLQSLSSVCIEKSSNQDILEKHLCSMIAGSLKQQVAQMTPEARLILLSYCEIRT